MKRYYIFKNTYKDGKVIDGIETKSIKIKEVIKNKIDLESSLSMLIELCKV